MTFHAYGTTRELDTDDHELCSPPYEEHEKQIDEIVTSSDGRGLRGSYVEWWGSVQK